MDCVNRKYGIEENSNFSSQFRAELHCASPIIYRFVCIQYYVFISCAIAISDNRHHDCYWCDRGEYMELH